MTFFTEDQLSQLGKGSVLDGLESIIGDGFADQVESLEGSEPANGTRVGNWVVWTDSQGFREVQHFPSAYHAEIALTAWRRSFEVVTAQVAELATLRDQETQLQHALASVTARMQELDALPPQEVEPELRALGETVLRSGKVLLTQVQADIAAVDSYAPTPTKESA